MPIIIPKFENLYLSLYLMAEIATHPYTKWQKSRPIAILELKSCDPSERHLRTSHFLGVNPRVLGVVQLTGNPPLKVSLRQRITHMNSSRRQTASRQNSPLESVS